MTEELKKVQKEFEKLFELLGLNIQFNINQTEEALEVNLETEEAGIIIGYHGDTLESLEVIMAFIASKTMGKSTRVYIEVGEYKKEREEHLKNLALQVKDQVLATGEAVSLPNLKSWERKFIHKFFQDDSDVTTESTGEGKDRTLSVITK